MSHTLFISDIHLQEESPEITAVFLRFLHEIAPKADALYILGDLFEIWVGDDDFTIFHQTIIKALRQLAQTGTKIYFMHGNRDFLIGNRFAQSCSLSLLPDPTVITLYDKPVLLSHGDILCTLDQKHQKYRKIVHKRWIQKLFLSMPLSWRRAIAKRLRHKSHAHQGITPDYITDVASETVTYLMQSHCTALLVHGHTHRQAVHDIAQHGFIGRRVVLGAWHTRGNALIYHEDGRYAFADVGSTNGGL